MVRLSDDVLECCIESRDRAPRTKRGMATAGASAWHSRNFVEDFLLVRYHHPPEFSTPSDFQIFYPILSFQYGQSLQFAYEHTKANELHRRPHSSQSNPFHHSSIAYSSRGSKPNPKLQAASSFPKAVSRSSTRRRFWPLGPEGWIRKASGSLRVSHRATRS